MTGLLARALLLRRLRSPARWLCLIVLVAQDLANVPLSGTTGPAEGAYAVLATLLLGAGVLGQERSDGSLSSMLTRPISRSQVVIAAWLATATAGAATWAGLTGLRLAMALLPGVDVGGEVRSWWVHASTAVLGSVAVASVVVLFGVLVRGLGGVVAQAGLLALATSLAGHASGTSSKLLRGLAHECVVALLPVPNMSELLQPGAWSWLPIVTAASDASLALVGACWLLGRAQLSYSDGD